MRQIVWGVGAQGDLRGIIDHYGRIDAGLPLLLIDRIEDAAAALIDFPGIGPELSDSDYRRWHARGTPFILFYRVAPDAIRIVAVRHARSDWQPR